MRVLRSEFLNLLATPRAPVLRNVSIKSLHTGNPVARVSFFLISLKIREMSLKRLFLARGESIYSRLGRVLRLSFKRACA